MRIKKEYLQGLTLAFFTPDLKVRSARVLLSQEASSKKSLNFRLFKPKTIFQHSISEMKCLRFSKVGQFKILIPSSYSISPRFCPSARRDALLWTFQVLVCLLLGNLPMPSLLPFGLNYSSFFSRFLPFLSIIRRHGCFNKTCFVHANQSNNRFSLQPAQQTFACGLGGKEFPVLAVPEMERLPKTFVLRQPCFLADVRLLRPSQHKRNKPDLLGNIDCDKVFVRMDECNYEYVIVSNQEYILIQACQQDHLIKENQHFM